MTFNSFRFIIFFAVVLAALLTLRKILCKTKYWKKVFEYILILFSYCFVIYSGWQGCLCLLFASIVTYCVPILMEKYPDYKKIFVIVGITISLIILGIFKYSNFFMNSAYALIGREHRPLRIILPIGISFYIFSAISYMVDVYRNKYAANKSFSHVILYMCFFPKIFSGPIVRADKFFKELDKTCGINVKDFEIGIQMFVIGMFKKMVLADHLSVFVTDVFGKPFAFSSITVLWALISYSLQLYFDFSGYSDMAIGIARMLGFHFDRNFDFPYTATNFTEFWKRWHISLSSWLQDYVYISLGGSRKGEIRRYINLFITMLLGGLWHGANWTYVIWGGLSGIGLIIHKLFVNWKYSKFGTKDGGNILWRIFSGILTYSYVVFGMLWFQAKNIKNAVDIIQSIVLCQDGIMHIYTWTIFAIILLIIVTLLRNIRKKEQHDGIAVLDLQTFWGLVLFFTLCGLTLGLAYVGNTAFIYGAF